MKIKHVLATLTFSMAAGFAAFGLANHQGRVAEETKAIATGDCFIKGTAFYYDMDDDWTGKAMGSLSGSEFQVTKVHLKTTDSFKFYVGSDWDKWYGYWEIDETYGQRDLWNYAGQGDLSPKEDGYYNFYIQNSAMYTTKIDVEPVDDGVYLRGSVIGDTYETQLEMTSIGDGKYSIKRTYQAWEKVKAISYSDGLGDYVAINEYSTADSNYFPVHKYDETGVTVEKAGTYTLVVDTTNKSYSLTDTASAWCREFLDSMTCDSDGKEEPEFKTGYSWTILGESFSALDEIARNTIAGAQANDKGSVIQEAASRYDTIVKNHKYTKFIKNSSDVYRSFDTTNFVVNDNNAALIITVISSVSLIAVASFFMLKKKKESK